MKEGDKVIRKIENQEDTWWLTMCKRYNILPNSVLTISKDNGITLMFDETDGCKASVLYYELVNSEAIYEIY
jgi:hypothetical protein